MTETGRATVSWQYFMSTGKDWGLQARILLWLSFVWKILWSWQGECLWHTVCIFWGSPLRCPPLSPALGLFLSHGGGCGWCWGTEAASAVVFVRVVPLLSQSLLERKLEQMFHWRIHHKFKLLLYHFSCFSWFAGWLFRSNLCVAYTIKALLRKTMFQLGLNK